MVTAKLIDRDGKFYIYEYRPEDKDNVGVFATTDDLKEIYIITESSDDPCHIYLKKTLRAIYMILEEKGEMPPKVVMQWY